ncbi:MAG: sigma-70 family RNA polymerase sigma factor [Candidatus Eremiobacteraeota bacterium]|nr:sigma-70 family RNA polymerase sigma factor [Candidatus Eremiobacteraeota bacterium]
MPEREAEVERLFPLLRRVALRVARIVPFADLDDLIGDGALGLLRAIDTYDARRGTSLPQYARHIIAGAMLNGLRRNDVISERVRRTLRQAENRRFALAQIYGRLPTLGELERQDAALANARRLANRHSTFSFDNPHIPERCLISEDEATEDCALRLVRYGEVRSAVASLPPREREVVTLHYGQSLSMRAIGRRMNISKQRASQLHTGAISRLRTRLPAA